ncbi:hypothetical protein D3218_00400 [Aureimonas flava]|uniref:Pilus assembly protein n=1 Tax=Aureimonas flava TaxID=2320271 RepID=A0A3A1WRS9_9HYPH|nr:hypothetical protein [Aureimonas flava]RIY03271.1 hypothetical protein D3218_00400 [Aureimonas flava]
MGQVLVVIAAALGLLLGGAGGYQLGYISGRVSGRAALLQEQALASAAAERERTQDDATIRDLSDADLCRRALRARGLPVAACDKLHRVP